MNLDQGNLTKVDRLARVIFGIFAVVGALLGFGSIYFLILGGVAIASGIFSVCLIKSILD